ncbi:glycerol-3-phosphate acyltransferase ATS11, chloroplastic-like isoform X3 [Magnolia sinica]|uniref:glycerol-3-phosphate acyltransferase ATS11, chloroplastic-like isoform X3 n=1 Tax=Magnolia sinica TaxID=86752 RepID=UPI0026594D6D|nr:glycerol-3-phosphate acyltransferase ATS11, chloroplastic-like isoform X3 [Magnolia sinica]
MTPCGRLFGGHIGSNANYALWFWWTAYGKSKPPGVRAAHVTSSKRRDLFGAFGRSSICDQAPYVWKFGHNVVLISNHQTEAEPMIIALLLETLHPHVAEKMTYVAGDRVVTDPVCKPFSMGRNLVCVYSKKHMHDIPELAEMKKKANTLSLKEMALLLRSSTWQGPPNARARQNIEMEVRLLGKEKRR